MATILDEILAYKRREVEHRKTEMPLARLERRLESAPPVRSLHRALTGTDGAGARIIAEIKRRSPVKGDLRGTLDPAVVADIYERHGAAAISLLTDFHFFSGRTEDLPLLRRDVGIPILRKEFIVDEYQLVESRALGADAVLLIVRGASRDRLYHLHRRALSLGMEVLMEVHSREELETALELDARILGLNNRNLATFVTDLRVTLDLLPEIPADRTVVSESGLRSRGDLERLEKAGVHAFLIGEALMKASDLGEKLEELIGG